MLCVFLAAIFLPFLVSWRAHVVRVVLQPSTRSELRDTRGMTETPIATTIDFLPLQMLHSLKGPPSQSKPENVHATTMRCMLLELLKLRNGCYFCCLHACKNIKTQLLFSLSFPPQTDRAELFCLEWESSLRNKGTTWMPNKKQLGESSRTHLTHEGERSPWSRTVWSGRSSFPSRFPFGV